MEIFRFENGCAPVPCSGLEAVPADGYIWLDFLRSEAAGWEQWPQRLLGTRIQGQHVEDALTVGHNSFFDSTPDYDMLIFEGLGPNNAVFPLETRSIALFVFDRLLVTVRAPDNVSVAAVQQKLRGMKARVPDCALGLAHLILDTMVDRYLGVREFLDRHITALQDELLGTDSGKDNWRALLEGRRVVRRIEALSQDQLEALDAWRRGTALEWNVSINVNMRDLAEHVSRVGSHAGDLERDIEAAVQLHFATLSQRANEIMQIFTVAAVVFMPLTLLTGIWGMNFKNMPELDWKYGYFIALGLLVTVGVGTYIWFRRRRFL
jgi:magnesium/cobalt transport protein CorA